MVGIGSWSVGIRQIVGAARQIFHCKHRADQRRVGRNNGRSTEDGFGFAGEGVAAVGHEQGLAGDGGVEGAGRTLPEEIFITRNHGLGRIKRGGQSRGSSIRGKGGLIKPRNPRATEGKGVEFDPKSLGPRLGEGMVAVEDEAAGKSFGVAGVVVNVLKGGGNVVVEDFLVHEEDALAGGAFGHGIKDQGQLARGGLTDFIEAQLIEGKF